ncbi:MAG: ABC transporter substrate-binding protein [Chloroflexi bacterium]|nr:ABC transporter substrate-binding protein [Chloroflexota bacterium]
MLKKSVGAAIGVAAMGAAALSLGTGAAIGADAKPCIGNSGPVTGPASFAGKSIRMGAEMAVDEINAAGGVLGKKLKFIQYDDAGAPPRGVDNVRRIGLRDNCVAMLGGYHSTVALAMRDPIHEIKMVYVGVIAANTNVIENGRNPNYMFRVSAKDRWVSKYLVAEALKRSANNKVGIMYENTGWGKGAYPNIQAALGEKGLKEVGAETFNWRDTDMTPQLIRLREAGAEALVMWGLDREGNQIMRSLQKIGWDPVKIGAWGFAGNLGELAGKLANCSLIMQTYSWMGKLEPQAQKLYDIMRKRYGIRSQKEIRMGSGVADAYDAIHILAKAIKIAGSYDRQEVYEAMFKVKHDGLVMKYDPAFERTEERHDAILPSAYKLTAWYNGELLPFSQTPCK